MLADFCNILTAVNQSEVPLYKDPDDDLTLLILEEDRSSYMFLEPQTVPTGDGEQVQLQPFLPCPCVAGCLTCPCQVTPWGRGSHGDRPGGPRWV